MGVRKKGGGQNLKLLPLKEKLERRSVRDVGLLGGDTRLLKSIRFRLEGCCGAKEGVDGREGGCEGALN